MLKIILIRHGEEVRIKENGVEYQRDKSPLTSKGVEQVRKLASRLKGLNINKIYSSDIKRAMQTTEIINKELNLDIKVDKRLRERNIGELEKYGDNWRKVFNKLKEGRLSKGIQLKEIRPPNGENLYDFRDRIKSFLISLAKKQGNILLSAHKGVNIAIINFAQDWNCLEFTPVEQNYACINILNLKNGKWNVSVINETAHLEQNEI